MGLPRRQTFKGELTRLHEWGLSINRLAGARGFAREFVERRGKADVAWTSFGSYGDVSFCHRRVNRLFSEWIDVV